MFKRKTLILLAIVLATNFYLGINRLVAVYGDKPFRAVLENRDLIIRDQGREFSGRSLHLDIDEFFLKEEFLTAEVLREFGASKLLAMDYKDSLPGQEAYAAVEVGGPSFRAYLDERNKELEEERAKAKDDEDNRRIKRLEELIRYHTRLFVVRIAPEAKSLIQKYGGREDFLIMKGKLSLYKRVKEGREKVEGRLYLTDFDDIDIPYRFIPSYNKVLASPKDDLSGYYCYGKGFKRQIRITLAQSSKLIPVLESFGLK